VPARLRKRGLVAKNYLYGFELFFLSRFHRLSLAFMGFELKTDDFLNRGCAHGGTTRFAERVPGWSINRHPLID
jgi:hypothetical protein